MTRRWHQGGEYAILRSNSGYPGYRPLLASLILDPGTPTIEVAVMKGSGKKQRLDPTSVRFGQRIPLEVLVRLGMDGRVLGRGTIRNASVSGALIETSLDLPLHTNLVVTLTIPDGNASVVRELDACVVRIDPAGLGVEWRDMASVDITDLLARATKTGAPA